MQYQVISSNNLLHIIDEDAFPIFRFGHDSLQEVRITDGCVCSECIFHLSASGKVPNDVLYKVAFFIQQYFPELYIDWFATFYYVEKTCYLKTSFEITEMLEGYPSHGDEKNMLRRYEAFEENEIVDDADDKILRIVKMNIIEFNVITG